MAKQVEARTYSDRRTYMITAVAKRRRKIKMMGVEYLGGKCGLCGYSKYVGALDFHHIVPSEKSFSFSQKGYTRSWEITRAELDKCALLCANCHREVEGGIIELPTGLRRRTKSIQL